MKCKIYFENYIIVDNTINNEKICVVENVITHDLCVQKTLDYYDIDVYKSLKSQHINNTPKIIDFIENDNKLIILREYIEGSTLDEYLHNKKYSTDMFYKHINTLCDIIDKFQKIKNLYNDEISIIHRDIKPENIIINNNDELYLFDLNAAKIYKQNETRDTMLIGTTNYAAPEQYGFGASNKSTDIYSIGKLIEYMSTFINDENFHNKFSVIISKCCKIDYRDRYKSINELKLDIFKSKHSFINLLIPGFRNFNILHMTIASMFYMIIIYLSFFYTVSDNVVINIGLFSMCILFIFIFFDYLDVQRFFPLTKSKNVLIKYLSKIIYSSIIPIIIYLIITHL